MLALASVVAVLAAAAAALVLWTRARRGRRARRPLNAPESGPGPGPGLQLPFDMGGDYLEEIRGHLAALNPLEQTTLKHLYREGMQTFTAERDSPVLRRLTRRGLLHAMGSDAYPADAYPYRIPMPVWSELGRLHGEPARGRD